MLIMLCKPLSRLTAHLFASAALLQQVMNLTPQQIELLPPQQKAQVLALQQQMVRALVLVSSCWKSNILIQISNCICFPFVAHTMLVIDGTG